MGRLWLECGEGGELPPALLHTSAKSSQAPAFPTLIFPGINAASNDQLNQIGRVPQAPKSRLIPGTRIAHSLRHGPRVEASAQSPHRSPVGPLGHPSGPQLPVCHRAICSGAVCLPVHLPFCSGMRKSAFLGTFTAHSSLSPQIEPIKSGSVQAITSPCTFLLLLL